MSIGTKTDQKTTEANRHVVVGAQSNDHSALLAGVPTERFFTDAATFTRVQLLVTEYYELDSPSNFWDNLLNLCVYDLYLLSAWHLKEALIF